MSPRSHGFRSEHGFTLLELLVVAALILVLAGLLLPVLARSKTTAKRSICLNNLKQTNLALRMYADDHGDAINMPAHTVGTQYDYHLFKQQVKAYVGLSGKAMPGEKVFTCPADTFSYTAGGYHSEGLRSQQATDFASFAFNGMNYRGTNSQTGIAFPGIAGRRLSSCRQPSKTVLAGEAAALTPYSWHHPTPPVDRYRCPDSRNVLSFVDSHVQEVCMFWNGRADSEAWHTDPPVQYPYQWSGD